MSLPNIPCIPEIPRIPPVSAISLILVSIALEEIGLSHIINAEGEKIQSVVKNHECGKVGVGELIAIDKSVSETLRNIIKKEILLELKMVEAFEALEKLECKESPCGTTYR